MILPITWAVLAIVLSYLIGSIPMGFIIARIVGKIDIREFGSGNIGLTNIIRTLGWGPGLVTGLLDFLKGYLPVLICMNAFSARDFGGVTAVYEAIIIMVAVTLVLGNLFPVYLMFKGGKGVATGLGVMSALLGVYIFIPLVVFGLFLAAFRFVSLASIAATVAVPVTVLLLATKLPFVTMSNGSTSAVGVLVFFTLASALIVVWRHMGNVQRIMAGTEPRVGKHKEPEIPTLSQRIEMQEQEAQAASDPDIVKEDDK